MNLIKLFLPFNSIIEFNQNNELFAYIMPNTASKKVAIMTMEMDI